MVRPICAYRCGAAPLADGRLGRSWPRLPLTSRKPALYRDSVEEAEELVVEDRFAGEVSQFRKRRVSVGMTSQVRAATINALSASVRTRGERDCRFHAE
jgi:hypothetical protein